MKIKLNKKFTTASSVLALVLLIFLFSTKSASANWGLDILGTIVSTIVSGLGWILSKLMGVLVYIAQYNDFIRSGAVTNGWIIARDISNMFFVVILLIIAFATILRVESYSYKKWLPKLILMAVLINFSKTICGLLIDLAQVIMLTFVNAFKDVGAGNLTEMLGIKDWQSLQGVEKISKWEVVAAFFLALIYVLISLVTVAAMIGMLVMRIIMIWVYVVLSPFAYLLSAFPGGQKYASQWWSEFTKNLIVGPVLAFFIWLSFASMSSMNSTAGSTGLGSDLQDNNAGNTAGGGGNVEISEATGNADSNQFGTSDLMVKFIVSIAMLMGGMKIASEIGGEAGSIAGKGLSKVKTLGAMGAGAVGGFALARAKWAGGKVKDAGVAVGGVAKAGIGTGLGFADRGLGVLANKALDKVGGAGTSQKLGLAGQGLIAGTAGMIAAAPGKLVAKTRASIAGSSETQEIDKARRKYFDDSKADPNAVMELSGKKYKSNNGKMEEFDDKTGTFTGNVLKDSSRGNKEVGAMNASSAAMYDSARKNFAPMAAKVDSKQAKEVEEAQKKVGASGMNTDEMMRAMKSANTSVVDKMALALTLAAKNAFKTTDDVKEAKKYISTNSEMSDKFDDEMDKKRPDLNYDFDNAADVATFKKRLDSGKIDSTKLGDNAYKNGKTLSVMQDYHGDEFGKVMQSVASRGSKYKSALSSGLNDMKAGMKPKEDAEAAARSEEITLRASGDTAGADKKKQEADGLRKGIRDVSATKAKISGEWEVSFTDTNGNFDKEGLGKFVASTEAKHLNNMSATDYDKLGSDAKEAVLKNINSAKLTAMLKDGSNDELVKKIVDSIKSKYNQGSIINPNQPNPTPSAQHNAILTNIQLNSL